MMQTNIPGVFAAGDIATFPRQIKPIATGFGEACIAVNFAKHLIDPKANIFPGHCFKYETIAIGSPGFIKIPRSFATTCSRSRRDS